MIARTTPLWIGGPNEKPPPLCGSIPPLKGYRVLPGDKVAAKNGDDWILAEVITNNESSSSLVVEDIDAIDLSKAKMTIPRGEILPLPQWRANPQCDGGALYEVGSAVMALYPQTTCFYKGIIASVPEQSTEDYIVLFEDPAYPRHWVYSYFISCYTEHNCRDYLKRLFSSHERTPKICGPIP